MCVCVCVCVCASPLSTQSRARGRGCHARRYRTLKAATSLFVFCFGLLFSHDCCYQGHESWEYRVASFQLVPTYTVVVYNPLSVCNDRTLEIADKCHIAYNIICPGARLRTSLGRSNSIQRDIKTHVVFYFGFGYGIFTNKSAGVSIYLRKKKLSLKHVV